MSTLNLTLKARTGPMTADLVLQPGKFGLGRVPGRMVPAATTTSVCGYCSTGCGLKIHLNAEGEAINLSADADYPVNLGMACPKGWEALAPLRAKDRATTPLRRNPETGALEPVDWPTALATFTGKMKRIQQEHGRGGIAFLSTGQIVTEEMALLGALFKFGMGGLHCDSNTRQCMATAHVAYKQSFGFDAPPFTYADFEESDALIFVGANPCIAHPILWQRVMMNRRQPEIVVLDPRTTETAQLATLHLGLKPKSDLTLLYGVAARLIERGAVKREFLSAHTTGFDAFELFVREFTPERVAHETGLPTAAIERLVEIIATRERVSFWWTMGVNQSHEATRTAQAIINLALMTGNIGRPGTGANSITGQCNAMGSRLFGNATSLIGGYDVTDGAQRAHVARILQLDPAVIPDRAGYAYDQILDAIDRGEIRGLWVIATNPAHSWIHQNRARAILEKLDFLVVQDMYATTETAALADLVLPAAGWGEKEGMMINSERRLSVARKVARPPGLALSDFAIFRLIAEAWGCGDRFARWESPRAAFEILKALSRGQPYDFTGIRDYDHLAEAGGIQWPYPDGAAASVAAELQPAGLEGSATASDHTTRLKRWCDRGDQGSTALIDPHRRLFADGRFFTPDGKARLHFDPPTPAPEPVSAAYPFILITGRGTSAQWHTGTRTNKSEVLRKLAPTVLTMDINPTDAARLAIQPGDRVIVSSRRGRAEAIAVLTATVSVGQVFLPMHFQAVNQLTLPVLDPHSRQPSYKTCAVRVERG